MSETSFTTAPAADAPKPIFVPEGAMGELAKRVSRYAKRAAKLGLPALSVEAVGEKLVDEVVPSNDPWKPWKKTGRKLVFIEIEVHGEAPVVAGYTFVAKVEHTEAGNIMSKAPGATEIPIPIEMRDGAAHCDHCNTKRDRNDTFILREDASGDLKRCGRNCLADFIRDTDAAAALRIWTLLSEIKAASADPDEPGSYGSCGPSYYGTESFLSYVSRSIELHGWTSKKAAYENEGLSPTADNASYGMEPPSPYDDKADWEKAQPLDHNKDEAKETLEWVKTLDDAKDYEHNLMVACSLGYVKTKNHGLVASAVAGYRRFKEKELYKARESKRTANSAHFGTIGSRYLRKLTITKSSSWDTQYGTTFLYTMEDETGNVFKWFSSNGCWFKFADADAERGLDAGDSLYFIFGVKDHGDWKGTLETTITRAKPSETAPKVKWLGAGNEIFKTKKAMVAAAAS